MEKKEHKQHFYGAVFPLIVAERKNKVKEKYKKQLLIVCLRFKL